MPNAMSLTESVRNFRWDAKSVGTLLAAVLSIAVLVVVISRATVFAPKSLTDISRSRPVIDAETNELFEDYTMKDGAKVPFTNPKTGRATLYPAETCFWTKDGKAKLEPTYVLLNQRAGKPGPTLCPDCGREVVGHNPMPPVELLAQAAKAAGK